MPLGKFIRGPRWLSISPSIRRFTSIFCKSLNFFKFSSGSEACDGAAATTAQYNKTIKKNDNRIMYVTSKKVVIISAHVDIFMFPFVSASMPAVRQTHHLKNNTGALKHNWSTSRFPACWCLCIKGCRDDSSQTYSVPVLSYPLPGYVWRRAFILDRMKAWKP